MESLSSAQGDLQSSENIGTLTSWQLLAAKAAADDGSSTDLGEEDSRFQEADDVDETHQGFKEKSFTSTKPHQSQLRSPSFYTPREAGSAAAAALEEPKDLVTPKPHQMLYKEYRVFHEIGSGAFGRVCVARRLVDGKDVVVKEIKTSNLSGKIKAATLAEVQVLASLCHPNIVKFHDCFMDDYYINIVMELCTAGDLAKLLKARQGQLLPEHHVMFLFLQICLALQYTHEAGVLHRDLKAGNCMLTTPASTSQGSSSSSSSSSVQADYASMPLLKLGDFGVAKVSGADGSMANTVVGTPQYLPPEMIDNKPYGRKSDVWALGCILYELCSLRKAFESDKIPVIFYKIAMGQYDPLPDSCSSDLKELTGKLLSRDVAGRPTVSEILGMPFVRMHLCLYLEWARSVPEAQPQVLLAGMGEQWSKAGAAPVTAAAVTVAAALDNLMASQVQLPGSASDSPAKAAAPVAVAALAAASQTIGLQPEPDSNSPGDTAATTAQMPAATPAAASSTNGLGAAGLSSGVTAPRASIMKVQSSNSQDLFTTAAPHQTTARSCAVAATDSPPAGQLQTAGSWNASLSASSRPSLISSSDTAGAAVLVSVVPKRESCTDCAAAAEHKGYQQLSSKQHQEQCLKQQQQQQHLQQQQRSPHASPQQSPLQLSPAGSAPASQRSSRRSTASVPMYCSMGEWLDGDVNLADTMQLQGTGAGAAAAVSVVTMVDDSSSPTLPVLQSRTSPPKSTAAMNSIDNASSALGAGDGRPFVQREQQQVGGMGPQEVPGSKKLVSSLMSVQRDACGDAAAAQPAKAGNGMTGMNNNSSSAHNSSVSGNTAGSVAVHGSRAVPLAPPGSPQSPDVHSWVAGLPESGSPAAAAMQQCVEQAGAAETALSDALKYSLDLSRQGSGSNCCSNSSNAVTAAAPSIAAAGAAHTTSTPQAKHGGVSNAAAGADESSSKDTGGGLPVTAIVLEQQEMLRRLKALKGRLGSSDGPAPAQAMRHGGGRLSPALSLTSSFTAAFAGGRQDGLSCRSEGRENSSSAVASKWGTHYI